MSRPYVGHCASRDGSGGWWWCGGRSSPQWSCRRGSPREELLRRGAGDLPGAPLVEVVSRRSAEGGDEKYEDAEHERAPSGNEPSDAPQRSEQGPRTRAAWVASKHDARRRSVSRHLRDRRTRAALQPGRDRDRVARRRHRRAVVAPRAARRSADRRSHARPPLVPAVHRVLRARPAAIRRGPARGRAAASVRESRRRGLPERREPRLPRRLGRGRHAARRPRRRARAARSPPASAPAARRTSSATGSSASSSSPARCRRSRRRARAPSSGYSVGCPTSFCTFAMYPFSRSKNSDWTLSQPPRSAIVKSEGGVGKSNVSSTAFETGR